MIFRRLPHTLLFLALLSFTVGWGGCGPPQEHMNKNTSTSGSEQRNYELDKRDKMIELQQKKIELLEAELDKLNDQLANLKGKDRNANR